METSLNPGLTQPVLSGTVGRRSGSRQLPFAPTGFDIEILAAADAALGRRIPLAVVIPPAVPAALLLGTCAVAAAALNRGKLNARIGVGSSRLGDRSFYDELTLGTQQLSSFVPRAALAADGTATVIGKATAAAAGRLFLTGSVERLLPHLDELEGVVLAGDSVATDQLRMFLDRAATLPLIYLTTDPSDRQLDAVLTAGGVVWAFDDTALARLAAPGAKPRTADSGALLADATALTSMAQAAVTMHVPTGTAILDDALETLWRAVAALAASLTPATSVAGAGAAYAARWAWGVTNAVLMLPVTPAEHDAYAPAGPYQLRLATVVDIARAFGRNTTGPARDSWAVFSDALDSALRAAAEQPRTPQLIGWVRQYLTESDGTATVLVRSAVTAAALTAAIDESPLTPVGWQDRITVRAASAITRSPQRTGTLCVPGLPPRGRATLLTQPPADAVTVLACGPAEARRAARMVVATRSTLAIRRQQTVAVSAPRLGVGIDLPPAGPVDRGVAVLENGTLTTVEVDDDLTDSAFDMDVDVLAILGATGTEDEDDDLPVRGDHPDTPADVPAIAVTLDVAGQPMALLVEPNDLLTRRRAATISRVAAKSLAYGDRLLLVDRAARTDLRVALTSKLSERQELGWLRMLVEFWHTRAAVGGGGCGLTQQEILDRMTGTAITTAGTIGNWIRGVVDGPADYDDITRFARAIGDDQLAAEAVRVGRALSTLHSVNRKLGHWLAAQVAGAATRNPAELVDAELGVHVADLLDSVSEHAVLDVDQTVRDVPAALVGHLHTPPLSPAGPSEP